MCTPTEPAPEFRSVPEPDGAAATSTMSSPAAVAVVGFYSSDDEAAQLRLTFERFDYPGKSLSLFRADREGELHSISTEVDEPTIALIHPRYEYPGNYLQELMALCDPTADAVWTVDGVERPGPIGDQANPDLYRSIVPKHVFRVLYSSLDRHIPASRRASRGRNVRVFVRESLRVDTHQELPNRLHQQNGLYWMIDYGHRIDRRCIEAYLRLKNIDLGLMALPHDEFCARLTPIQYRHLLFFLNTNVAGERGVGYLSKHIDLARVRSALDVGSGYGGLVRALGNRGCRATGLELEARLSDIAELNVTGHEQHAELIVGDFLTEPLPPSGYDLVTMTDVIEHVADVEFAIERIATVLTEGGYAYIKVPNYKYIDFVREDSHTGLFAISLLRHEPACAYLRAARGMEYSVGEYYDYDYYVETCAKYGLQLVNSDNVATPLDDAPGLLEGTRDAFERWKTEISLDPTMKDSITETVDRYLAAFEAGSVQPDDTFTRDYLTSHWNLFLEKRADRVTASRPAPTGS